MDDYVHPILTRATKTVPSTVPAKLTTDGTLDTQPEEADFDSETKTKEDNEDSFSEGDEEESLSPFRKGGIPKAWVREA